MWLVTALFFVLIAADTYGQLTTEVINQDNISNWQNTSDIDPRALVVLTDGRIVYFEDDSGFSASVEDSLILINPSLPDDNGRYSVLASEPDLLSLGGSGSCCSFVSDLALDESHNLYAMVSDTRNSNQSSENYIVRFPWNGSNFEEPVRYSDFFDGGYEGYKTFHRLAVNGANVYASFDDREGGDQNGIYTQPAINNGGETQDFQLLVSHNELAAAAFGTPPGEVFQVTAMGADHQGGVLLVFHEMALSGGDYEEAQGAILRLTADGDITRVLSSAQASTATGAANTFANFTLLAVDRDSGDFFTFETGTSGKREQLWHWSPSGEFQGQAGGYHQTRDAGQFESESLQSGGANSMGLHGNLLYYWSADNNAGKETLFRVDLSEVQKPVLEWPDGSAQNDDVSCHYGPRQLFSGGYRHDFHRGIDMAMPLGTALYSAAPGTVDQVIYDANENQHRLRIRHHTHGYAPTVYSWYNHLSAVLVSEGDTVGNGPEPIALSGADNQYEHLHFGVRVYNGGPDYAVNPLAYLPYVNSAPLPPVFLGGAQANGQRLAYVEIAANDEELDFAGIEIEQESAVTVWDWAKMNRENAENLLAQLDQPIVRLRNGVTLGVFPEWMRADIDQARIRLAIAGLESSTSQPQVRLLDVHGGFSALDLPDVQGPLVPAATFEAVQALANQPVSIDFTLTNVTMNPLAIDLEAKSAMQLDLSVPEGSLHFAAGETKVVTIEVMVEGDANNLGDAVLLVARHNGNNVLTVLRELVPSP